MRKRSQRRPRRAGSLRLARQTLAQRIADGEKVKCPCCQKEVQSERITVTRQMAEYLLWVYRHYGHSEWKRPDVKLERDEERKRHGKKPGSTDDTRLQHFGLIARKSNKWYVTLRGARWIRGETKIERHVWTYDNRVWKREPELVGRDSTLPGWDFDAFMAKTL
jgi:hypothetical protein